MTNSGAAGAAENVDSRVVDYLNDKIQVTEDLANVDSLLRSVNNQQLLLKQQLYEAELALSKARSLSQGYASSTLQRITEFQEQQKDIDRRLQIITQSDASDDAARRFQHTIDKLRRLDVATGYVNLLKHVDDLSLEAHKHIKSSPQAALGPYTRLKQISSSLQSLQSDAEGAAPHLVDHVESASRTLWDQMTGILGGEFEVTLSKLQWPNKDASLEGDMLDEWQRGVERLLDLQMPQRLIERLQPEYFMSHVISLLNTYIDFFAEYLQPVLTDHFAGSDLALEAVYADSTSALITALLPMLRRKVLTVIPLVANQAQLLSHFIHELIGFDSSLREEWGYDGGCGAENWKGLTWEILVQKDWFGRWLQVEKEFALSRYQDIIDAPDGREIDYESVEPNATKPTKAAIRVNDLLETITDRYRPLTSFTQKLRFLMDIQIAIFDKFHDRLHSGLEAYRAATSTVARAVQGVSKDELASVQGVSGLERLCRIYGSAEYLEKAMDDWSDDVFFLELWDELQERARSHTGGNLAGNMSLGDVAERTSSAVGSDDEAGALFDETASAYRKVRLQTEEMMIELLASTARECLRPYSRINPWSSLSTDDSTATITAELDPLIQTLASLLGYLKTAVSRAPLRHISRQLVLSIQTYLWDYTLQRNNFSLAGAKQFSRDVAAICAVMDRHVGDMQAEVGMKRLVEAVSLLTLEHGPRPGGSDVERSDAGDDAGRDVTTAKATIENELSGRLGLEQVEKAVFESNERARDTLAQLGLVTLSESDARGILEKRVELGW
ncbi:MAG: hypothetical protein M1825_001532 [Sarcosagium campestre]|nr:MAG: hypothetical protein M1825_001532 [Sarcosagium campestre]